MFARMLVRVRGYEAEKLPAGTPERPLTLPLGVHSSGAQAQSRASLSRMPCGTPDAPGHVNR